MKKLLIYVPTYQAKDRIKILLERFQEELIGYEDQVDLHINDNASNYDISNIYPVSNNIKITRNSFNEGGAANVNKVFYFNSFYKFTWVIGDDDIIMPGSISRLVKLLEKYDPDFVFLNTISFDDDRKNEILEYFKKFRKLPTRKGRLKSNLYKKVVLTHFSKLIDPRIDDVLLGSIMCGLFKTDLVKDFSSDKFPDGNNTTIWTSYPHVINYAKSLNPKAKSVYDPFIYTFNFWDGGNTWKDEYDIVVALGLLYSIKNYAENKHLDTKKENKLLKHYLNISYKSRYNLYSKNNINILDQYNEVYPYILSRYEIDNDNTIKKYLKNILTYIRIYF